VSAISATSFETDVKLLSDPNAAQTNQFCDEFLLSLDLAPCASASDILLLNPFLGGHANEDANGCVCDLPSFTNTVGEHVVLNIHSDGAENGNHVIPEFGITSIALAAITAFGFLLLALVKGKLYNAGRI
jgi:hypothetical protein